MTIYSNHTFTLYFAAFALLLRPSQASDNLETKEHMLPRPLRGKMIDLKITIDPNHSNMPKDFEDIKTPDYPLYSV
jgi:hypothetical protein